MPDWLIALAIVWVVLSLPAGIAIGRWIKHRDGR